MRFLATFPRLAWPGMLLMGLLLTGPSARGQAEEKQSPAREAPAEQEQRVIRATTRLVQVSVVVLDGKGNPVPGLTAADFTLYDEKTEQTIAFFSAETFAPAAAPAAPLPPDTFTNRPEEQVRRQGAVSVVLLDSLNTPIADLAYARDQVLRFLETIEVEDHVALYGLGTRVHVLHDFTGDPEALRAALRLHKNRMGDELDSSTPEAAPAGMDPDVSAWLDVILQGNANSHADRRARITAAALEAIALRLAHIPGRKNLIWVSGSFPIAVGDTLDASSRSVFRNRRDLSPYLLRAGRALNGADVAVYPVDPRGLFGAFGSSRTFDQSLWVTPTARSLPRRRRPQPPPSMLADVGPTVDAMRLVAETTGGRAFYNTNDVTGSIRKAVEESRVTYTLGFYPNHGKWDGSYRRLRVRVNRSGVQLRHRQGYLATATEAPATVDAQAAALELAANPLDATAVGLTATAAVEDGPESRAVQLALRLDGRDVTFHSHQAVWRAKLEFRFVLIDQQGLPGLVASQDFEIELDSAGYREAKEKGLTLQRSFHLPAGTPSLRIVVQDMLSGARGSVAVPLERLAATR